MRVDSVLRRIALLGSAVLLILTLQFLPLRRLERTQGAHEWVDRTLRVLNASAQLLSISENAESSVRAYLLTGDNSFLQPVRSLMSKNLQAKLTLDKLTTDSPAQQARIDRLDHLVDKRLAELMRITALYKTDGRQAIEGEVRNGTGRRVMGEIRSLVSEINQDEHRLLAIRTQEFNAETVSLARTLRTGGIVLVIMLVIFGLVNERDIYSRQQQAKEQLKTSEDQFQTLANAIPHLCWMANGDGGIFWYNERWYDFTATKLADMEGWGWQSVHDPEVLPIVLTAWNKSIALREPFEMILPLKAANGTFHPFLTRVVPLRDLNGKVNRWFGTHTDITGQRAIEDALRENRESLRLAQEVARIGTFEWNLQTGEKQRSPELEAMYGYAPGEFAAQQKTGVDPIFPEDQERVRERLREAMETGESEGEWRVIWPNGEERWHLGRVRIVKDETGKPARAIGAIVDITERKLAALTVLELNADLERRVFQRTFQLEAANKELGAFAYSVSHDLRAPLRGIDGWSLALQEDYGAKLDKRALEYLDRVRSETQRMGQLVDDMLQLSRVTRDDLHLVPIDLTALALGIAGRLRDAQPERSLEFVISPALVAAGDERLLEIALTNLFNNAVKFTGKQNKPRIEFGRAEKEGEMAYYVRDNGAGFDMAYASKLFSAFQRLHKVSEFPGTGIGLAIVQRIFSKHGGRVWADGKVNQGATIWFTLEVYA